MLQMGIQIAILAQKQQMTPNGPHRCRHYGTGAKLDIEGGTWYWNPSDGTGAITAAPVP